MSDFFSRLFACWGPRDREGEQDSLSPQRFIGGPKNGIEPKLRPKNEDDYSISLQRNKKNIPIIKIAVNMLVKEWGETDSGIDPVDRPWNLETETMKSILKHQNRAALAIDALNNNESYTYPAADYYYVLDGAWSNQWK